MSKLGFDHDNMVHGEQFVDNTIYSTKVARLRQGKDQALLVANLATANLMVCTADRLLIEAGQLTGTLDRVDNETDRNVR